MDVLLSAVDAVVYFMVFVIGVAAIAIGSADGEFGEFSLGVFFVALVALKIAFALGMRITFGV